MPVVVTDDGNFKLAKNTGVDIGNVTIGLVDAVQEYVSGELSETLSAPGTSTSRDISKSLHITIQYTVSAINTNVVVRAEGSLDDTNWFNLDNNDVDVTITSNGTYGFVFQGKIKNVRFNFVSEAGGTDATIKILILGGN